MNAFSEQNSIVCRGLALHRFSIISQVCCHTSCHVGSWGLTLLGTLESMWEHISQVTPHQRLRSWGLLSTVSQTVNGLGLFPKNLNCLAFPACHVFMSSHWWPEKVFSQETKLASGVRLASMESASVGGCWLDPGRISYTWSFHPQVQGCWLHVTSWW